MSLAGKAQRLRRLLALYPSLAQLPVAIRSGQVITLAGAIRLLEAGDAWIAERLREKGLDPSPEETRLLALEFYRMIWRRVPSLKLYVLASIGEPLTLEEIERHIMAGDELGEKLVRLYEKLLRLAAELQG